ncbi:hypothetical protein JW916_03330 [Candidatus Sumerlaeota bacterium]|nr:hypothetical protein [Candidatus Sumerlaeota bacterium]
MRTIIGILAISLLSGGWAYGDVIELADGRLYTGVVTNETSDTVEVFSSSVVLSLSRLGIRRVTRESQAANTLHRARFELERDRPLSAFDRVEEAMSQGATPAELRAWFARERALVALCLGRERADAPLTWRGLIRRLAGLSDKPAQAASGPTAADDFPTTVPLPLLPDGGELVSAPKQVLVSSSSPTLGSVAPSSATLGPPALTSDSLSVPSLSDEEIDYLLAMAEMFDGAKDTATAAEMIERLEPPALHRAATDRDFVQPLLLKSLRDALDVQDFRRASDLIRRMESADLGVTHAARILLCIRWSAEERRRGNADLAFRVLDERLRPLNAVIADELGNIALTELRQSLAEQGRYGEVADLVRKWGPRFLVESWKGILANIYREWGGEMLSQGEPSKAKRAFEECARLDPELGATQIRICEFEERFLDLEAGDWASAFDLGQWAAEQGLLSQAVRAYERAAAHEQLREPAEEQIAVLRERIGIAHYERCLEWFEHGDPQRALVELDQFPFFPSTRSLEPEIQRLRALCWTEIDRRGKLRGADAEILFQNAYREYFLGKGEDAKRDLNLVMRKYGDTSAAGRAREFLRYIEMRRGLSALEGSSAGGAVSPGESPGASPGAMSSALENEIRGLIEQLDIGPPEAK